MTTYDRTQVTEPQTDPNPRTAGPLANQLVDDQLQALNDATPFLAKKFGTIQDAIDEAAASGFARVLIDEPMTHGGDLYLRPNVLLETPSWEQVLTIDSGALLIDAEAAGENILGFGTKNLAIQRIGTVGPAIYQKGAQVGSAAATAPARFRHDRLKVVGSTGDGVKLQASYLGSFITPLLQGCAGIALNMVTGGTGGSSLSANAVNLFGGEIQGNGQALYGENLQQFGLIGTDVEGNQVGCDFGFNCRVLDITGDFEANGEFDIRCGNGGAPAGYGLNIDAACFNDGSAAAPLSGKDYSIILVRQTGVDIGGGTTFTGYNKAPIKVIEAAAGQVRGVVRRSVTHQAGGTTDVVELNGAKQFLCEAPNTVIAVADGDTTPSVAQGDKFLISNSSPTLISNLDDPTTGKEVTLIFGTNQSTLVQGGSGFLRLQNHVNWANPQVPSAITLVYDGTSWIETGRSSN